MSAVAPTLTHKAGFHPTAVFGAVGAAVGVGAALKLSPRQMVDALGIVGSWRSGIIEYLAEGAWTKRLHAGWAAQSGLRAALLGRAGIFRSAHGVRRRARFVPRLRQHHRRGIMTRSPATSAAGWVTETLAFKPYPCGTMTHPYIDCARKLAKRGVESRRYRRHGLRGRRGHRASLVGAARLEASSGQRLCRQIFVALLHRHGLRPRQCGFKRFHRRRGEGSGCARRSPPKFVIRSTRTIPIRRISPATSAPLLRDGTVVEERQPYMRGGAQEPLTRADIELEIFAQL